MNTRQSIYIEGFRHKNPIPAAARIGNMLMSGIINGVDPATGAIAPTLEEQCSFMFTHVRCILEKAGGTPEAILKMTVWLKDRSQREALNNEWLRMFPDPQTRPARHTLAGNMEGSILVQCDFTAVLG